MAILYSTKGSERKPVALPECDWIHIYAGKPVPPIKDGSYNHLIWELIQQRPSRQLLISRYYPGSFGMARDRGIHAVYIQYTPKVWLRDRIKPILSDQVITPDREFILSAVSIISQTNCSKILLWGAIHQLAYYRWAFPDKTIAYAHRWYEQLEPKWASQYSYCDYLITLSGGASRRAFEQAYSLCPVVIAIPNGVDLCKYKPVSNEEKKAARRSLGVPEDKLVAIFPSVLRRRKGTDYLAHWIEYCLGHLPDVHFLVVGGVEETDYQSHDMMKLQHLLQASRNVTWLGGVSYHQMATCYSASDICLMPTVYAEGMSMASLEALASGLPVICTKHGIFRDYIFHEYNGLLCNPEALYKEGINSIASVARSPGLLSAMGANARVYAERRLCRQRCLQNFSYLFDGDLARIDGDLLP